MHRFRSLPAAAALALLLAAPVAATAAEKPGYKAIEFTQYSSQSGYEFAIPEDGAPVRIDIAARIEGKPVGGSMLFSALVTRDAGTGAISWIGTDSDGRVKAGSTASGDRVLARLSGPDGEHYAVLRTAGGKKLKVVQQDGAKGAKGHYSVRIWY